MSFAVTGPVRKLLAKQVDLPVLRDIDTVIPGVIDRHGVICVYTILLNRSQLRLNPPKLWWFHR
jgi:hypothetical protein